MKALRTARGELRLPAFFPDATLAAVKAASFEDVRRAGLFGCEMNTYHLMNRPGPKTVKALGGLHGFTGYDGVILTDSGGFQLYSLIRENSAYGEVRDNEIIFRPDMGREKLTYTPEKCIQAQLAYGSDILMALDMCTHPEDPPEVQARSVDLTVRWGRQCREAFDRLTARMPSDEKPLLFGIVQGGSDPDLRARCAEQLEEIGFDGYGFGGWPLDGDGNFWPELLKMAADAMPDGKIKYAMGLGRPEEIVQCVAMGYALFDCVIPTREARHQRLYVFREGMDTPDGVRVPDGRFYRHHYILDPENARDPRPVDASCDCELCRGHSRAYLHHLFKCGDPRALQLATAHNLRFYGRLMECLAEDGQ